MGIRRLLATIGIILLGLIILKIIVHSIGLELIVVNALLSAVIGAVIFTIGLLLSGTLPDYKESEKIPGDMAASIKALYKDVEIAVPKDKKLQKSFQISVKNLLGSIVSNFKSGIWKQTAINKHLEQINDNIADLSKKGVTANHLIKMRNEIITIEKLSNRIETIKQTKFIPSAYAIAKIVVIAILGILVFTSIEPFFEGIILIGVIGFLLLGLLVLIRDIDDPFDVEKHPIAAVDLRPIYKLEKYFNGEK